MSESTVPKRSSGGPVETGAIARPRAKFPRRIRPGVIPRVALYWHNGRSLGHTSESARVAEGLLEVMPGAAIVGVSGARHGFDRFPADVDIVKLPSFRNYDTPDGTIRRPVLPLTEREFRVIRERMLESFFDSFRPHALVLNHLPQGSGLEITPVLPKLAGSLRVLTLRGILHDRAQTEAEYFDPTMASWIAENFDAISIHTDPDVFRLEEYYEIPEAISDLFHYSGYVVPPLDTTREEARGQVGVGAGERLVVASLGGGQGAIEIWRGVLAAFEAVAADVDRFVIATGPYLEDDAVREIEERAARLSRVEVARYRPDLILWMRAADVFVGAAGHNTVGEVLSAAANAILVPRQLQEVEQLMHASLLAERGLIRTVLRDEVDDLLQEALRAALAEPCDPSSGIRLGGGRATGRLVRDLLFGGTADLASAPGSP